MEKYFIVNFKFEKGILNITVIKREKIYEEFYSLNQEVIEEILENKILNQDSNEVSIDYFPCFLSEINDIFICDNSIDINFEEEFQRYNNIGKRVDIYLLPSRAFMDCLYKIKTYYSNKKNEKYKIKEEFSLALKNSENNIKDNLSEKILKENSRNIENIENFEKIEGQTSEIETDLKDLSKKNLNKKNLNKENLNEESINRESLSEINLNKEKLDSENLNAKKLNREKLNRESLNREKLNREEFNIQMEIPDELKNKDRENIYENIYDILSEDTPIAVKTIGIIILKAIELNSSDIHIEPFEKYLRVRFRIDGSLRTITKLNIDLGVSLVARLKILAHLDIVEKRNPQDGRFKYNIEGKDVDFRLSTMLTMYGEKSVIRILNKDATDFNLQSLYLSDYNYDLILKAISKKSGLVIVSGPTGSGKTSTLYSMLTYLNEEDVNILTVEDPIEYHIDGINQVQCFPEIGLDFATILRAFFRQDPDVVMVGEIRDRETSENAIRASLTGHLVFTTVHSENTLSSIDRLINLGVDPFLISSATTVIISQRLLRKLCDTCRVVDENYEAKLRLINLCDKKHKRSMFYRKKGCKNCGNTGYKGRIGIFEVLYLTEELKKLISNYQINNEKIKEYVKLNMKTLKEDGLNKCLSGLTSLDELLRVL